MEALYLLCSAVSTLLISSILSILLPFNALLRYFSPAVTDAIRLYHGHVRHVRRRPVPHAFGYPVRYALVDLDRPSEVPLPLSFFRSHMSSDEVRRVTGTTGPVFLLTMPPSVGYEQNPLSVYYCYDLEGSTTALKKCIAEVTNTPWGERVSFVFNPDSDLVAKPLHVSPFMDMLGNWTMRADAPGDDLFIEISVQHPTLGDYFTATLNAKRISSSSWTHSPALFFWLMPQKVALWIYWQALKLWWKKVSFLDHPKYLNPMYREDSLMRNRDLQCAWTSEQRKKNPSLFDNNHLCDSSGRNNGDRWCIWRDAEWLWT